MLNTHTSVQPMLKPGFDMDVIIEAPRPRVMIVDDDADTVLLLKQVLRNSGYDVMGATSGEEALFKFESCHPDLVLLDIIMPDEDGWEIFRKIQTISNVPVIAVTARGSKQEVVDGLCRGVEDYIVKPFYTAEVVERVNKVLRRLGKKTEVNQLEFTRTGLSVNLKTHQVSLRDNDVLLNPKEFDFVALLARKSPEVVTYQEISLVLWRKDYTHVIRKYINYVAFSVRNKFEKVWPEANLIVNFAGWGYKLLAEVQVTSKSIHQI